MLKFIITAKMENGDIWETIRHTKEGLNEVISNILKDEAVVSFSVEEKKLEIFYRPKDEIYVSG